MKYIPGKKLSFLKTGIIRNEEQLNSAIYTKRQVMENAFPPLITIAYARTSIKLEF